MIRIGVYGLGKISYRVIQGILYANNADLYAVCSSNLEKANAFKAFEGISTKKVNCNRKVTPKIGVTFKLLLKCHSMTFLLLST